MPSCQYFHELEFLAAHYQPRDSSFTNNGPPPSMCTSQELYQHSNKQKSNNDSIVDITDKDTMENQDVYSIQSQKKHKPNSFEPSLIEIHGKETAASDRESQNLYYFKRHNDNNNKQTITNGHDSTETQSSDENNPNLLFCRSLVGLMDELTPQQNMLARIKIQQILYQVKFNTTSLELSL